MHWVWTGVRVPAVRGTLLTADGHGVVQMLNCRLGR